MVKIVGQSSQNKSLMDELRKLSDEYIVINNYRVRLFDDIHCDDDR
jgi:hypothetical protein